MTDNSRTPDDKNVPDIPAAPSAKPIGRIPEGLSPERRYLPVSLEKIPAGFPAPNGGYIDGRLDLNEFCISHPASSYIFQVIGDSMIEAGILPDDYLVVDRAREARHGDIVIAEVNQEFTVKYLELVPAPRLVPANRNYRPILITPELECQIIGVVVTSLRKY